MDSGKIFRTYPPADHTVAQVSQPAVSPTSSRQALDFDRVQIGKPRHARIRSLRYRLRASRAALRIFLVICVAICLRLFFHTFGGMPEARGESCVIKRGHCFRSRRVGPSGRSGIPLGCNLSITRLPVVVLSAASGRPPATIWHPSGMRPTFGPCKLHGNGLAA